MRETKAEYLHIEKLHPFEGHPFKVADNEEMDQLIESILTQGVLTPLVVRFWKMENMRSSPATGGYTLARERGSKAFLP